MISTPPLSVSDRMRRQEINEDTDLNHSINHDGNLNRTREGVPFKCARNTHKDHILDHETYLDEMIRVVHSVSSAHMELNKKSTTGRYLKPQIYGRRNGTILNNCGSKRKKGNETVYFTMNENANTR